MSIFPTEKANFLKNKGGLMGTDACAKLYVTIPFFDVGDVRKRVKIVTKYDENTGEPYKEPKLIRQKIVFGNLEVETSEVKGLNPWALDDLLREKFGLEILEDRNGQYFIAKVVADADDAHDSFLRDSRVFLEENDLSKAIIEFKELLKKIGIGKDVHPKLCLEKLYC